MAKIEASAGTLGARADVGGDVHRAVEVREQALLHGTVAKEGLRSRWIKHSLRSKTRACKIALSTVSMVDNYHP